MTSNVREKEKAQNWLLGLIERGEKGWGASVEEVTPARALVMLENNPANRNLKTSKIDQYADDMSGGRWIPENGETIKIAITGELNDGQNRLSAVVKTGLTFPFLIVYGLSRDSRFTVDIGATRTVGDALSLQGQAYAGLIAAASRRLLSFERSGTFSNTGRISAPQAMRFGIENELLQRDAVAAHNLQKHFRAMKVPASEITMLLYLFDKKTGEKGQAKNFFSRFALGNNMDVGNPIHTLRTVLLSGKKRSLADKAELIIKAWNAWIRDEELKQINVNGRIPEIKGPKRATANVGK